MGTSTLVVYKKLGGIVGIIEDVVVDEKHRSKGVGSKLTKELLIKGQELGIKFVDVNTRREKAKEFYLKHGFGEKTSNRPFYSLRYYFTS